MQASLRQPCPDPPRLPGGSGLDLLPWLLDLIREYRICQNRHRQLVLAIPPIDEAADK